MKNVIRYPMEQKFQRWDLVHGLFQMNGFTGSEGCGKIGYRHFDTAQAYGNERGVGEGIRTCGVQREELFCRIKSCR